MGQPSFIDLERRLDTLSAKDDPLETIKTTVPWETFRADIEAVTGKKAKERKSSAGRKPYDAILKFKILVLQSLYNLSDEQTEFLIRDRLSFMRFLDLGLEETVPDATTIWLFREALVEAGFIDKLFERFGQHLQANGYLARGGQIIDATIVSAPKQRNSGDENDKVKAGQTPEDWEKKPAQNRQKDKDARWTKKHGRSYYGATRITSVSTRRTSSSASGPRPTPRRMTASTSTTFSMKATPPKMCGPTAPTVRLRSRRSCGGEA
ncbi:MAG: IS5 family transposase [Rhodothermales bacterium]|jgi:IS5 family transposase